jgi:16S rRNA (uracil1498-N3)-methyltransferase
MRPHRKLQRLHVAEPLRECAILPLEKAQSHYLLNVLRMAAGVEILVFNGRDGEWLATVEREGKRDARLLLGRQTRPQLPAPDVRLCLAPIKSAKFEFAVQKATELGAGAILPVITAYGQVGSPNLERMRAIAVEAAEQCGALSVPEILEPVRLPDWLRDRAPGRPLVFCDEAAATADPIAPLRKIAGGPVDILVGPEGGFSPAEREMLLAHPGIVPISLGPRILRAETAALAALVLVEAARWPVKAASE